MPIESWHHTSHSCNISAGFFSDIQWSDRNSHQWKWGLGYVVKVQNLKLYPNFLVYWGVCPSLKWYWVAWNTIQMRQILAPVWWLQISLYCFSRLFIVTAIYHSDQCCLLIAFCFIIVMSSSPVGCFCVLGICQEHFCTAQSSVNLHSIVRLISAVFWKI